MPSFEVEFEVVCSCGNGLCRQVSATSKNGVFSVSVEPCEKCMEREYDKGNESGYDMGYSHGLMDGEEGE